jgi:hypothetical protein
VWMGKAIGAPGNMDLERFGRHWKQLGARSLFGRCFCCRWSLLRYGVLG